MDLTLLTVVFHAFLIKDPVVTLVFPDLCREDHWGPWVCHGGALRMGNGHGQPALLQEELCKIWILQETAGECVFCTLYRWLDPFSAHDYNHWEVHFIIVGLFPRSHGFYNPRNKWVRGSFPAHTGIGYFGLWCSFIPCLTIRRLFFDIKICIVLLHTSQTFLKSSSCPEIHGHLHAKELTRKSWKKLYFILRRSGLYFSNKGTSKVRRNTCFFLLNKYMNQKWSRQTRDSKKRNTDLSSNCKNTSWNNFCPDWKVIMFSLYTAGSQVHPLYTWYCRG